MTLINSARRVAGWLAVAAMAASLSACAGAARPDNMIVTTNGAAALAPADPGYKAFRVTHVDGGSKTNPVWMSAVSSDDFQKALEDSLRVMGLLADDPASAKTEITANLQDLQRPLAGIDMTVTSRVHYSAKSTTGQQVVFDDVVAASGTAKFSDSLLAVERLRLANEASIKENIKSFIERLRSSMAEGKVASN
jgi:hypothetical protein